MIIGLCGLKQSGKSTAARYLIQKRGFVRHSLADPLKKMLKVIGLTDEQLWGGHKEVPIALLDGKTPRHAMQTLGTEWGRNCISDDFWLRVWFETLPPGDVVCDDVRFENEADMIRRLGGVVVEIARPVLVEMPRADRHASELLGFTSDETILNLGTVEELEQDIAALVDTYAFRADASAELLA